MLNRLIVPTAVAAAILGTSCAEAAPPSAQKAGAILAPLRENDPDPYVKELPGENVGDGGGFSIGSKNYVRLEGRHLTFRTMAGLKKCVISTAAAKAWTFGRTGTIGCDDVRMTKRVNGRVRSENGEPVILTVTQGARSSAINGLWQGLE